MGIAHRQQFPATRRQPAVARVGLALWTVPVSARVERDGAIPAAGALVDVTAKLRGATEDDGSQNLQMQPGEPFPAVLVECGSGCVDEVGHLQGWPRHLLRGERERIQWAGCSPHVTLRKMDVDHRLAQIGVPEQQLNGAQVGASLEQMGGEAMPERLLVLLMICSQEKSAIAFIRCMAQKSR